MNLSTTPFHRHNAVNGAEPTFWFGTTVPDGDAVNFYSAGVGSTYVYRTADGTVRNYVKVKNDGADNDWSPGVVTLRQTVAYTDFTDGEAAVGTLDLDETIPVGAYVLACTVTGVTGFAGDTSCTLTVGDGSDVDRFNTGTPSIFATAGAIDMGPLSGNEHVTTAVTVTLTATSGSDWGAVTAGAATISLFYLL